MADRRLVWQLFPSYLLVTWAGILGVSIFAAQSLRESYLEQSRADLRARAAIATAHFGEMLQRGAEPSALDDTAERIGEASGTRITVLRADGTVLADTSHDPQSMESHADRPEVVGALEGRVSDSIRYSTTVEQMLMYVAAPIERDGEVEAVVRLSVPMTGFERAVGAVRTQVFLAAAVFAGLAALVNWWVSKKIVRPIERLTDDAKRFASGEHRVPAPHATRELHELSDAVTEMAQQLEERIQRAREEKSEREAVLSSMVEGVIAVDLDKRVLNVNPAASALLSIDAQAAAGRRLSEVVRNAALHDLVDDTLSERGPSDTEFDLQRDTNRHIQARGTMLRRASNEPIGAVVVLNDVTRLKKLEQVRKDFVSNVSHELKTPLTSIKGFVETLLDGALEKPEDGRRFLEIIGKQVDRLSAIIEDLLILSRLEQDEETAPESMLEAASVAGPVEEAVQVCARAAQEKRIEIETTAPAGLYANLNAPLMEQCIVNLLDNAIKYSEPGGKVRVSVLREGDMIGIAVADQGAGISSEHLDRLFERFYRVDRARSRSVGGTGLGLSIVRHIVELHGGTIGVQSELGKGSTFRIALPAVPAPTRAPRDELNAGLST